MVGNEGDGGQERTDARRAAGRSHALRGSLRVAHGGRLRIRSSNRPTPRCVCARARDQLAFVTSALDIAVGSAPEVDLLDMVTLVALGRDAMARRWKSRHVRRSRARRGRGVPCVHGRHLGRGVRRDLRRRRGRAAQVIRQWQEEKPDHDDVAGVRLSAYAKYGRAREQRGALLVAARASETADTAVLLGDRALYATQRLPNLVRLHVRIARPETVGDAQRAAKQVLFKGAALLGGLALAGGASWAVARLAQRLAAR